MKKKLMIKKNTIKNFYVDAIVKYQHNEDVKAIRKDVRVRCQWNPNASIEIYCEDGIMNATDIIHSYNPVGSDPAKSVRYCSEIWIAMDAYVNQQLEFLDYDVKVYSAPVNDAVVAVYQF